MVPQHANNIKLTKLLIIKLQELSFITSLSILFFTFKLLRHGTHSISITLLHQEQQTQRILWTGERNQHTIVWQAENLPYKISQPLSPSRVVYHQTGTGTIFREKSLCSGLLHSMLHFPFNQMKTRSLVSRGSLILENIYDQVA